MCDDPPFVALTFDDGPGPWTGPILDILAAHEVQGSFFLIGRAIRGNERLVERMAAEGHEIGNHSWSHPRLAESCSDDEVQEELQRTNDVIAEITGSTPTLVRAPQYNVDERVEAVAARLSLRHVRGDIRPPDWVPACRAEFIATFIMGQLRSRAIVGVHDGVPPHRVGPDVTRRPTVDAVGLVVPRLAALGYECLPAGKLLAREELLPAADLRHRVGAPRSASPSAAGNAVA